MPEYWKEYFVLSQWSEITFFSPVQHALFSALICIKIRHVQNSTKLHIFPSDRFQNSQKRKAIGPDQ